MVGLGAAVPLVANGVLERLVLGQAIRGGRAGGTAREAGAALGQRVDDALVTTLGFNGFRDTVDVVIGGLFVVMLGVGVWLIVRRNNRVVGPALVALAGAVVLARFSNGTGYVPGVFVACPLAVVGLVLAWARVECRWVACVALGSLPLVWYSQFSGNMRPQWGGRYVLVTGALLAVVGVVAAAKHRGILVATAAIAVLMTGAGVMLLSERTHSIADGFEDLVAVRGTVISTEGHILREGGAFYTPRRHWLTAIGEPEVREAFRVARESGDTRARVITAAHAKVAPPAGWERVSAATVEIRPGEPLRVVEFRYSVAPMPARRGSATGLGAPM